MPSNVFALLMVLISSLMVGALTWSVIGDYKACDKHVPNIVYALTCLLSALLIVMVLLVLPLASIFSDAVTGTSFVLLLAESIALIFSIVAISVNAAETKKSAEKDTPNEKNDEEDDE